MKEWKRERKWVKELSRQIQTLEEKDWRLNARLEDHTPKRVVVTGLCQT